MRICCTSGNGMVGKSIHFDYIIHLEADIGGLFKNFDSEYNDVFK